MKLVMFQNSGDPRLGCLADHQVIDLNLAHEAMLTAKRVLRPRAKAELMIPPETVAFLEGGDESLQAARKTVKWVGTGKNKGLSVRNSPVVLPVEKVKLLAPVLKPSKIICVAHNYHDFLKELGMKPHPEPRIFAKFANAVASWDDPIPRPAMTQALGYEAELAFVIGKPCKHVPEAEAYHYIAGYMGLNDVSASDLTKRDGQNLRGKSFDAFAPMGPFLLTADELPDPHNLDVELRVNGRVLQKSNTSQLVHNVPQLVAFCSQVFSLEPGDVVATGTPGGLAKDRKPTTYMNPGDIMETEIEKLGVLRNPITAE
jgi:acylpyruvate hydrolase